MSDKTTTFSEVLKNVTTVAGVAGKSMLLTDANGNPSKVSLSGAVSGLNAESANKLTIKKLTNEDLNNIKDDYFTTYYGDSSNTCLNRPEDVSVFYFINLYSNGHWRHVLFDHLDRIYTRYWTGSNWLAWKRILTEKDLSSLTARIAALEAKLS